MLAGAKQVLTLVLGIGVAAPGMAPLPPSPTPAQPINDGEATAAACLPLGFDLARAGLRTPVQYAGPATARTGAQGRPPPVGTSAPPPPITMPIQPTKKEDRVEYQGPPVIVPGPPPPPAPPPPASRPATADEIVMTGSRIRPGPGQPPYPGQPPADTERYPDATPNPVRRVADEPVSTFSIDVDTASYTNVRRFIEDGSAPPRDAVRVEEMINAFDYGYPRPTRLDEPFAITTATVASPWSKPEDRREIVHIGLQGYELPESERRPLNLTFLVDVSGSMNSPDKLGLAQRSMNLVIDRLRPQDTVAVTYYAEGAGTTLSPTPGTDKLKIRCAVASLYASGGTAGATGMTNAYDQAQAQFGRGKVNRILMFTDGDFNVGVTDDKRLEDYVAEKRATGIYLSVYGFGRGNYQDARMQTISQAGNGTAGYVADLNEARRLFGPAFDKGAFPIADDVKVQVEFNPARVSEYRLIGYETRLLNEEDFDNDAIDAGEVGSGASVTALYEITPVGAPTRMAERRYAANRSEAAGAGPEGEIGFVQVRYKRPGEPTSRLIQNAITNVGPNRPSESTRWALAVAAYGQKLRADSWMDTDYGWSAILDQAQGSRGEDAFGDRAEFVQLVRASQTLPTRGRP